MEDILTVAQIKECLADAVNDAQMEVEGDCIAKELSKAWNRGARHMEDCLMLNIYRLIEANRRTNK